jgi:hypothetical protein
MATPSGRTKFAQEAVQSAVEVLGRLPESDDKQRLRGEAYACERAIERWKHQAPTPEQQEATMKRILKLHIEAARLARACAGEEDS